MTILTYYNPSSAGRSALERAVTEAASTQSAVEVFNAPAAAAVAADETLSRLLGSADDRGVVTRLRAAGETSRSPLEFLVSETGRADVQLVVIGLQRRSAVGKLLMGSVEQQILLRSEAPVLALKGD